MTDFLKGLKEEVAMALKYSSWGNAAPILHDHIPKLIEAHEMLVNTLDNVVQVIGYDCLPSCDASVDSHAEGCRLATMVCDALARVAKLLEETNGR